MRLYTDALFSSALFSYVLFSSALFSYVLFSSALFSGHPCPLTYQWYYEWAQSSSILRPLFILSYEPLPVRSREGEGGRGQPPLWIHFLTEVASQSRPAGKKLTYTLKGPIHDSDFQPQPRSAAIKWLRLWLTGCLPTHAATDRYNLSQFMLINFIDKFR